MRVTFFFVYLYRGGYPLSIATPPAKIGKNFALGACGGVKCRLTTVMGGYSFLSVFVVVVSWVSLKYLTKYS